MANGNSYLPISPEQLEDSCLPALNYLKSVRWVSPKIKSKPATTQLDVLAQLTASATGSQDEVKILEYLHNLCRNSEYLSDNANHVTETVHRGLMIGFFLAINYTRASKLEQLMESNRKGILLEAEKKEFNDKKMTAAAITVFGAAYYIVWKLSQFKTEAVSNLDITFPGFSNGEFSLLDMPRSTQCIMYYYGAFLRDSGKVSTDLDLIKATIVYFQGVIDEVKSVSSSLNCIEPFTSVGYKLTDEEFSISGFTADLSGRVSSVEFKRVDIKTIVGNKIALHLARRIALRLACYKPSEKRNVMFDLGFMSNLRMGYGTPGTGKSMIIGAIATLLHDYCEELGIPFFFNPLPNNIISSFQGKTAENADNWFLPIFDPTKIVYAPIDDAENNLEDRTRQGVSEGTRQFIGVFLRRTEGASAVWLGNSLIDLFTNIPDQIDPAPLSRIVSRFPVDGARSYADFIDQDHLWEEKLRMIDPTFINISDPKDYEYMTAQAQLTSLSDAYADYREAKEPVVRELIELVGKSYTINQQEFFARLYVEVQQRFPKFSSRDLRNVQKAIDERLGDFDFPTDWLNDMRHPDNFFQLPTDRQKQMINELMKTNMKGLSYADVRLQEVTRYLDNMVAITETGERREIERMATQLRREDAARKQAREAVQ